MKGVKRVDKPLSGLKVEMRVIFSKVSEQLKCELRALKLLTAACGSPGIGIINKVSVKGTYA